MAAGTPTAHIPATGREQLAGGAEEKLTVAEILRIGAATATDRSTCPQVQSVLAKLSLCRTHVMGGRKFQCQDCGETSSLYNSCGDRHCPQCSGSKRVDFHEKASKLVLDGVVYYQVVFTLPSELSELALANRHVMADLLSTSAWKSLSGSIEKEQGYQPAGISVLHSWNQKLEAHWHVHMLVPGEGPALGSPTWKKAVAPPESSNSDGHYLVDAERLRHAYRKRAIRKLRRLRAEGELKFGGKFAYLRSDDNWEAFVKNLESATWNAFIQPPPPRTSGPAEVVKYLTRYLTGGPISDHRIVAADRHEVTFLAREGNRAGGEPEQVPLTLPIDEFVRRWCLHIQPDQLTKTRYFGGWSNSCRSSYLSRCRELLAARSEQEDVRSEPESCAADREETPPVCPQCGSDRLELLQATPRPSWKTLFWHQAETCPWWYAELRLADDRRFWDGEYGAGFYDWYLETQVEGAKEIGPPGPPPAVQLYLPGLAPTRCFALESF